jgi:hypothetical protein
MKRTETVLKMLDHLLFNHLVCLPAWESFNEFSHCESFRSYTFFRVAYENQTKNDVRQTYSASIASSINMAEAVLMK